jgi:hypothetical protein
MPATSRRRLRHTTGDFVMNRYALAIALATIAAAGQVFADDITIDTTPFTSTATRAQVQAELQQFRAAGVNPLADDYNPLHQFRGTKTRAEVTAEFLRSRDAVAAMTGEDSGSFYLSRQKKAPAAAPASTIAGQPVNAQ